MEQLAIQISMQMSCKSFKGSSKIISVGGLH